MYTFGSSTYQTSHSFNCSTNYLKKKYLNPLSFNYHVFFSRLPNQVWALVRIT